MMPPRLLVLALLVAPVPCQEHAIEHALGAATIPVIDREWRSRTDEALPGELVGVHGDRAELLRADGRRVRIPVTVFCDEDRAVIEKWWKRNAPPADFGDPDVTIVITTLRAQMKYDKARIEVPPKAKVRLILRNLDDMPHNLIICRPPADDKGLEVAQAAWKLEGEGFAKEWIPKHARVMHASGMVYAKESHSLWFKAPAKEGLYPYVCTFPGHAMMMNGVMAVSDQKSGLSDLRYRLFQGRWDKLPDFSKLDPVAKGAVADNLVSLKPKKKGEEFGLVFDGTLHVPLGGKYEFKLASDDGSALYIDGKRVIDNDGVHGKKTVAGKVKLAAGEHALEVDFFERNGGESLALEWSGPGFKNERLSKDRISGRGGGGASAIELVADGEAIIYRNFIQDAGSRAIGVGYPEQIHLAYDANHLDVALLWRGKFMNAGRHWTGRGQGFESPMGSDLLKLPSGVPFAVLSASDEKWPAVLPPGKVRPADGYTFGGYVLDAGRKPTFRYTFRGLEVEDRFDPVVESFTPFFRRTLTLRTTDSEPPSSFWYRIAAGAQIAQQSDGAWVVDGELRCLVEQPAGQAVVRRIGGRSELLLEIVPGKGETRIRHTLGWN